jgi:hypothetical protein
MGAKFWAAINFLHHQNMKTVFFFAPDEVLGHLLYSTSSIRDAPTADRHHCLLPNEQNVLDIAVQNIILLLFLNIRCIVFYVKFHNIKCMAGM